MYEDQIASIVSLKKLSAYEGPYNLYEVSIDYDYDLDALTGEPCRTDQGYLDAAVAQVLPGIPITVTAPKFACSAFRAMGPDGVLMGRNYDFKDDTSALLVRTKPKDGYASIAFCALNNLRANVADEGLKSRAAAIVAPFACLDGVNEKGVSIAVLTLDSEPVDQATEKPAISTSLAIRLVLDRAATTEEAVSLLSSYDMHASAGRDYHFFISDATGDSRVVEYDPADAGRALVATPAREITNYYALYADKVAPNQHNGIYGHGKERALAIARVLDAHEGEQDVAVAWEGLRAAAQDPNPDDITSNTQWSIVYSNTRRTAAFTLRRHWGDVFEFGVQ